MNQYIDQITDKQNGAVFYVTGSANPATAPFLMSGLNTSNSGINYLRVRSSGDGSVGTFTRSSLVSKSPFEGLVLDINKPVDLFFTMRIRTGLPSPLTSSKRYMNWGIIFSGEGFVGLPTPALSDLTFAYQFYNSNATNIRFFVGIRNSVAPRFQVDYPNQQVNTTNFGIINWIYDGLRPDYANGIGQAGNNHLFLYNNQGGTLTAVSSGSVTASGANEFDTIGYTGRNSWGLTASANVVQDYEFGERLIFDRILTPTERQFVFNYLSGKWGVTN
jgi:hypothetical protein